MKVSMAAGLIGCLVAVSAFGAEGSSAGRRIEFSSLDTGHAHNVSGTLYLPVKASRRVPAIVLIHGTTGIDMRGALYREPLLKAGIAIFEVDFKTGIYHGPMDRPKPDTFLPMAFAALREMRKVPSIDPNRIGVMGFSMGGHIALAAALEANTRQWMGNEKGFAAFALFYPVCKPFMKDLKRSNSKLTGAPMIIFYGTEDSYGEGRAVPELKNLFASKYGFDVLTVEYAGATHGFNRNAPSLDYRDPAAENSRARMAWNPEAANDSIVKVVAFLKKNLATN